jgi:hypothetical protein
VGREAKGAWEAAATHSKPPERRGFPPSQRRLTVGNSLRDATQERVDGYARAGRKGPGEKKIVFGRNTLQIVIFWYFVVLPPYPLPKTYDEWVRREG